MLIYKLNGMFKNKGTMNSSVLMFTLFKLLTVQVRDDGADRRARPFPTSSTFPYAYKDSALVKPNKAVGKTG
jgi:hypothetical protein